MLRVLAGLGLSIGEFTHEIKQYRPAIYSHIHNLKVIDLPNNAIQEVDGLKISLMIYLYILIFLI